MKILAFTDIHDSNPHFKILFDRIKKEKVDLVICAGDFTIFGHNMKKVLDKISKMHDKIILTHGNHEYGREVEELCRSYKNITYLHKARVIIGDVTIFSYGGGGFAYED